MNAEREVSCKRSQIYGDAQIRESWKRFMQQFKKKTVAMQEENKDHDRPTNVQNKLGRKVWPGIRQRSSYASVDLRFVWERRQLNHWESSYCCDYEVDAWGNVPSAQLV